MTTDIERLRAAVLGRIEDFDCNAMDADKATRDVVDAVLEVLRVPSEAAAQAGGNAAMQASMSFRPPAFIGLAAIQATIDHLKDEDA